MLLSPEVYNSVFIQKHPSDDIDAIVDLPRNLTELKFQVCNLCQILHHLYPSYQTQLSKMLEQSKFNQINKIWDLTGLKIGVRVYKLSDYYTI